MSAFPFENYPLLVCCWHQQGCPACEEFLPRFRAIAERYKACIPTAILDANEYSDDADGLFVRATPSIMIVRQGQRSPYLLSDLSDPGIEGYYQIVLRSQRLGGQFCELG